MYVDNIQRQGDYVAYTCHHISPKIHNSKKSNIAVENAAG